MVTLLASLIGFLSSLIPELMKYFFDKSDKNHEIKILEYQIALQKQNAGKSLEEVITSNGIGEMHSLYKTYKTGISWVDAFNGTVRPVLAYAFFIIYSLVKYLQYKLLLDSYELIDCLEILWTLEDQAIFAGIISFYFGQRAISKIRGK